MIASQLTLASPSAACLLDPEPLSTDGRRADEFDRSMLTLSPYRATVPNTGGTKRIHFLNRGYARAGWDVVQVGAASFKRGAAQLFEVGLQRPGLPACEIAPGYREAIYFNPFVIFGNRILRQAGAAQVAASMLPPALRFAPRMVRELRRRRVVMFEHPHMFALAEPHLRPDHIVVLDAHNIESRLYEGGTGLAGAAARSLRKVERACMARADLIFACSDEDRAIATAEFGVDPARIHVAPNGVDLETVPFVEQAARTAAKASLGLSGTTALFVGSRWGPNIEAAEAILSMAHEAPGVTWLIVGSVGEALRGPHPSNVRVSGTIDDLTLWYAAADVAVNPMASGSGSNIKMFEYLAAGLPVVATPFGARGVEDPSGEAVVKADLADTVSSVLRLASHHSLAVRRASARRIAEEKYDWTSIARGISDTILSVSVDRR